MGNAIATNRPAVARTLIRLLCMGLTPCQRETLSLLQPEQILIKKLIGKRHAFVLEDLGVFIDYTVERHLDGPGPRVCERIVERGFVPDVVRSEKSEALGNFQLIAVMIAGAIEPGVAV